MAGKKDRGRFTIKFNENDPAHDMAIRILEKQGPHSKAPFIVNAILHYIHCSETPDISILQRQAVDRASIEAIVIEILKQQGIEECKAPGRAIAPTTIAPKQLKNLEKTDSESGKQQMDEEMMALIASTMSAFRSNN